jgi:hypothetical protein
LDGHEEGAVQIKERLQENKGMDRDMDKTSGKTDIATGRTLTRQTFRFVNSKSESLFLQRKNPRKIAWTQVYRRCVVVPREIWMF